MALEQSLENDGTITRTSVTMNYPSNGFEEAEEALKFSGESLPELKRKSTSNGNVQVGGHGSGWLRRTSGTNIQSIPNSSRGNNGSLTPTLSRKYSDLVCFLNTPCSGFWNSIKNFGDEEESTNSRPGTQK